MTDTYLEHIWTDKVDEHDIAALQMCIKASIFGHTVEGILTEVHNFNAQLWRGSWNGKRFVIVSQIFEHPGGREFKIWFVGGKGYTQALNHSYAILENYAKSYGCKWITGFVRRKGFEKLYARFNFKKALEFWIVEIDNVSDQTKH